MKKFYEKPVVEITKFAFEDIMTASSNVTQAIATSQEAEAAIEAIESAGLPANTRAKNYFTYKW